jgi:hypothetical protein
MPDLDAANIAFNLLKALGDAVNVGPILAGVAKPAHVLTQSITVRGIVNMSAIAVVDAQEYAVARDAAAPCLSYRTRQDRQKAPSWGLLSILPWSESFAEVAL